MRKKATSHKKRLAISQSTTVTSKQKKKKNMLSVSHSRKNISNANLILKQ